MTKRALLLAALAFAAACSSKDQKAPSAAESLADAAKAKSLPDEHYASPTEKFSITLPGAWTGHYAASEKKDTTGGARMAVEFKFKPDSASKAPPLTAIVVRVIPKKVWEANQAKGARPVGAMFGELGDDVFILSLPSSNPYPPGTADADTYDRMIISLSQGGQHIHVAAK